MANVNNACASILETVIHSGLDFHINQTPYSIHFSLRRKFSKNVSKKIPLNYPNETSSQGVTDVDRFRQELLQTRNEYVKLYNFYEAEQEARFKLEVENKKLIENYANEKKSTENIKSLKIENSSLKNKLEDKSMELKHSKSELENLKQDKNALSVALKTSKAEIKEQRREFEKKVTELEEKIIELYDFKKSKLAEERELKLKNRKEIKKAKQKIKKEENYINEEKKQNEIVPEPVENPDETIATEDFKTEDPEETLETLETPEPEETVDLSGEVVDEKHDAFIGPKLPRRMTPEEIEEFRKELFSKYFPT